MNRQILIIGLGRSGTTYLFRAFRAHPQVKTALLEEMLLCKKKSRAAIFRKYPGFKKAGVEKINYMQTSITKRGKNYNITAAEYAYRWLETFGDSARIIHIVRHPLDTIQSLIVKKNRQRKYNPVPQELISEMLERYYEIAPKIPMAIFALPHTYTFKYEYLMTNNKVMQKRMYSFCGLSPNYFHPEIVRSYRAFNYKETGYVPPKSVDHIIELFNQIAKGMNYEV